jgi:hypothetical protein
MQTIMDPEPMDESADEAVMVDVRGLYTSELLLI